MIKFTLDELLFHRKIKIPKLIEMSGINKTTIYNIYNNKSTRIDMDVLDRLCIALACEPQDIIKFIKKEDIK